MLGAVDVVGSDVFAVSVLVMEPWAALVDVSLDALKGLLAVGVPVLNLKVSWLIEVAASASNTLLGVEEDIIPSAELLVELCGGPLRVDSAAVLKIELIIVEDEGCASVVEVVLGIWASEGDVFRAADALAMPSPTCILGCVKGFTAHVCALNSSS